MDQRDRLILALSALANAEREAREALQDAIAGGVFSPEMRAALADRSGSAVGEEDMEAARAFLPPEKSNLRLDT
ncbi:hypothetical protein RB623_00880 [Mesorhizobium sp. LHD-90]|uniref:hypothetical protein n=1 Tax=Mesorhizobium sp. LHD-90 TaxID=3071414 RepID=UPI0027DF840C|nr:hypothetical protein [Mesorhizobium sp. LHD-90]MDQ6432603.1 hypothetical protein [Mesorhizobium sp. LHD-90]